MGYSVQLHDDADDQPPVGKITLESKNLSLQHPSQFDLLKSPKIFLTLRTEHRTANLNSAVHFRHCRAFSLHVTAYMYM